VAKQLKQKNNMRNIIIGLTVLSILSSCHKDEHGHDIIFPTTDVRLNVDSQSRSNVNRDDVPVTVESISVEVTSAITGTVVLADYDLVDDGSGVDGFVVADVPLGANDFTALTTASGSQVYNSLSINQNAILEDVLDDKKSAIPYVIFEGETLDADITGDNDFINIDMNTDYGRIITLIKMDDSLTDDYYYSITVFTNQEVAELMTFTNSNKRYLSMWSNIDSVDGQVQIHTVRVYAKSNDVEIVNYDIVSTVTASVGQTNVYTILADGLQSEESGLNFTFQSWSEVDGGN
jgi:hypothetical protein